MNLSATVKRKESKKYSQKVLVPKMGKTHKFSRGHSSSFVPDYRHVVENMGDSEGFGGSIRADTEMASLDNSRAPKRKHFSLNADNCDGFGVPLQVISVSKMPRLEREELKWNLRAELEHVRIVQKKISIWFANGVGFSSSSDNGRKKPSLEKSESVKKQGPSGQSGGGPHMKRGLSGRFESVKQGALSNTSHVMLMKQCETLLKQLMSHKFGWVFNTPVDVEKLNIPDYFTVIKNPMDLGTVKNKLASGLYSNPLGFLADVRLTFSNAMTYNQPGHDVHLMASTLSKHFEVRWKSIAKKLPVTDSESVPEKSGVSKEAKAAKPMPMVKKRNISLVDSKVKLDPVKQVMTDEDKHNLSRDLESLITELPVHIIDFLREHSFNANRTGEDEIEVDIDDLSDDALLTLRKLVDEHLQEKQEKLTRYERCEMEILNDSGLSNSSMQPCKGNDPVDEDVDIGGNDPPISSYPPVEIEKDTANRNSSSSSSSSRNSDSGSSSDSESDGSKSTSPATRMKETLGSGENLDRERSDDVDPHDGNQSVSGLDQLEQTSHPGPVSVEADSCQEEGESAPSERQVSPQKLYRAALLKRRFADTILKAREKALDKGEKGDPEKLRREREELERQQRKEKARLQAEAKALEDARRQDEAKAAAEIKRKRELEREAARLALLKMEKTVEINENSQFLEDLEMLRVASVENLPSSVDETSPNHSEDGMGGFKLLGSSNPLEQLGLYIKVDEEEDEEEEEGEPKCFEDPLMNDVEEGEID